MVRVLYVCPSSGIGGAETFIKNTWRERDKSRFHNIYLLWRDGPLAEFLRNESAPVIVLDFIPRLSNPISHKKFADALKKIIKQEKINLVHSTMAYGAIFAAWACWSMRTPHVWFQHGPASGWMDQLAAVLPNKMIIGNSDFTLKRQLELEKSFPYFLSNPAKHIKLTLGTQIQSMDASEVKLGRQQLCRELQIPDDAFLVSMLCRLQEWKGVHILLHAIRDLSEKPEAKKLYGLIWGDIFRDERYLESLKQYVEENNLPVFFMGATANPNLALAMSDLLVNASIQPEPFGLSIIEAMAVGTPVIVPDEGGPIEIVNPNKTGFVFEARNPKDLGEKILEVIKLPNRQLMKATCLKEARERFDIKKTVRALEKIHGDVIGGKAQNP